MSGVKVESGTCKTRRSSGRVEFQGRYDEKPVVIGVVTPSSATKLVFTSVDADGFGWRVVDRGRSRATFMLHWTAVCSPEMKERDDGCT